MPSGSQTCTNSLEDDDKKSLGQRGWEDVRELMHGSGGGSAESEVWSTCGILPEEVRMEHYFDIRAAKHYGVEGTAGVVRIDGEEARAVVAPGGKEG